MPDDNDYKLVMKTDVDVISKKSRYSLLVLKIAKDYLDNWDAMCSNMKMYYAISRSYAGNEKGRVYIEISCRREDLRKIKKISDTLKSFGYNYIEYT